jgi:hypothetical protein
MTERTGLDHARRGRGVGFCTSPSCPDFLQLRPQVPAPEEYRCPTCARPAGLELERGVRRGTGPIVSDVRVEFDFDPRRCIYLGHVAMRAARVLRPSGVFTLQTPLVRNERAARALAAALLRELSAPQHFARALRIAPLAPPERLPTIR